MKFFFAYLISVVAFASPVKVITSSTDLAWAAKEIGKGHVQVKSLLRGSENPHFVDTIPEFVREVADADVVCIVGLDLEVGWMPNVLKRSGNAKVQPGGPGYCEVGRAVTVLEKPSAPLDRSMGDVHPSGNPHFWLSPTAFKEGGQAIRDALVRVDSANRDAYGSGYQQFAKKLDELHAGNRKRLGKLAAAKPFVEYHREFSYFFDAYGLKSVGSIEEKPGVPPSVGRLGEVAQSAKQSQVAGALSAPYAPKKVLERFSAMSGIPHIELPTSIAPDAGIPDYPALQEKIVGVLIQHLQTASDDRKARAH